MRMYLSSRICQSSPHYVHHRYEWFISLEFDWDFVSGKKKFRWPLVSIAAELEGGACLHWDSYSILLTVICYSLPWLGCKFEEPKPPFWRTKKRCTAQLHSTRRGTLLVVVHFFPALLMIRSEVDCQALYTFNQLAGDAAVGLASINLSIRTWVLIVNPRSLRLDVSPGWPFGHKIAILSASLSLWSWDIGLSFCKVIFVIDNEFGLLRSP